MGLGRLISNSITHTNLHNQTTNWLVHNWSTFGAKTNHGQIRTHKTHHGPDLGEAPTFPLIVYFVPGHRISTQMSFCFMIPVTLGAHNFVCKPSIEIKSKEKLQPLLRAFQRYVARHLHVRKSGQFLTFNGQESNCQN